MHKQEIIRSLAHRCGVTIQDTETLINEFMKLACETVQSGDEFNLTGLFKIRYKDKQPRIQHNPKTGKEFTSKHRLLTEIKRGSMLKALDKDVEQ